MLLSVKEFAAWLGLVPRQHSTGGKAKPLGISKHGNPYLRKMFIHGAPTAVRRTKREEELVQTNAIFMVEVRLPGMARVPISASMSTSRGLPSALHGTGPTATPLELTWNVPALLPTVKQNRA